MLALIRRLGTGLFEDTSRAGKLAPLDGLRAIAVLTVFLSHTSLRSQIVTPRLNFSGIGHVGVYLFFVLSGFLLAHTLFGSRQSLQAFYLRRFFRIFPLYAVVVTAVFAFQSPGEVKDMNYLFVTDGLAGYLRHLTFIEGDGIFWTIAAEFQFYIVLPFLVLALLRYGMRAAIACAVFALAYGAWYSAIMFKLVPQTYALKVAVIPQNSQFVDVFLCGVLAAYAHHSANVRAWIAAQRSWLVPATLLFTGAVALGTLVGVAKWFLIFYQPAFWIRDLSVLYGVAFALILLASVNDHRLLATFLGLPPLRFIGVIAFGWYLLHMPIIWSVNHFTAGTFAEAGAIRFALSFVLCSVAGTLCYLLIEKPAIKMGKRLITPRR